MTENQRLKDIRLHFRKTQSEFGAVFSLKQGSYADVERGKVKVSGEIKRILEKEFSINIEWLETGTGNMFLETNNIAEPTSDYKVKVIEAEPLHLASDPRDYNNDGSKFEELGDGTIRMRIKVIPNYAFASGYLEGFQDPEFYEGFETVSIEVFKRHQGHYLAFEVRGDSMTTLEPEHFRKSIFDGVKVIGRELPRQQWRYKLHTHTWNAWVIVHRDMGIMVKEIIDQDVDNGTITIHSLNPDKKKYPDRTLRLDDIEQIFNVVKKIDE